MKPPFAALLLASSACATTPPPPASAPSTELLCRSEILSVQAETAHAWKADQDAEGRAQKCQTMLDEEVRSLQNKVTEAQDELHALKTALLRRLQPLIAAGTVSVELRNGHMVVKLPSSVLFATGSAELGRTGREALAQVSVALRDIGPYDLMVAGHTDSRPIHTHLFKDNWDLSTARAAQVVRFLVAQGLDPHGLMAAGMASYDPLTSDGSPAGLEQNRRIEIILVPHAQPAASAAASEPASP